MTSLIDFHTDPYTLQLVLGGVITLLAATVPNLIKNRNITAPIIYLVIGIIIFVFTNSYSAIAALNNVDTIRKISEFVVLIALVNAGLKISNPFQWSTWRYSFWLLMITMPLTIIASAWVSWHLLGFAPAAAILFGALIAPTDPVLAGDLQTTRPSKRDISRTRLALTSEAGINDGLAFPFVFFAIYLASKGNDVSEWFQDWLMVDVAYKIMTGIIVGLLSGWLLYKIIYQLTSKNQHAQISRGILSLSLALLPYAVTEMIGGYGFIAVFVASCIFSNNEKLNLHMDSLHDFTEEIERIFVALLFVTMGLYVGSNWEFLWDFELIMTAAIIIFIIRPVFGWLAVCRSDLSGFEKFVVSCYGIRGVGSIYYLMYALTKFEFEDAQRLIHVTAVTITLSILIHGVSAAAIKEKLGTYDSNKSKQSV